MRQKSSIQNFVTSSHLQRQLETLVSGLILIFPSLVMSGIALRLVFIYIRDLKWGYLAHKAALLATNALVGSWLDYSNSLFRSLSALDIRRLQCVQNSLARIVPNTTKYSHITPVRKSFLGLPMMHRSVFKMALLVYKFLHSGYPKYFEPFLKPRYSLYRTHRSQSDGVLLHRLTSTNTRLPWSVIACASNSCHEDFKPRVNSGFEVYKFWQATQHPWTYFIPVCVH